MCGEPTACVIPDASANSCSKPARDRGRPRGPHTTGLSPECKTGEVFDASHRDARLNRRFVRQLVHPWPRGPTIARAARRAGPASTVTPGSLVCFLRGHGGLVDVNGAPGKAQAPEPMLGRQLLHPPELGVQLREGRFGPLYRDVCTLPSHLCRPSSCSSPAVAPSRVASAPWRSRADARCARLWIASPRSQ
jgi:hypothetical protein